MKPVTYLGLALAYVLFASACGKLLRRRRNNA